MPCETPTTLDLPTFLKEVRKEILFVLPGIGVLRPYHTASKAVYLEHSLKPGIHSVDANKALTVHMLDSAIVLRGVFVTVVGSDYKHAFALCVYTATTAIPVYLPKLMEGSYAEADRVARCAQNVWADLTKQAKESGICRVNQQLKK